MKEYVTWEQVEDFIDSLKENLGCEFSGVYGLPRGGLVLAVMISHRFGIPMLMSPCPNCLIVDDICDSGESLLHYVRNSSGTEESYFTDGYDIATMYYKPNKLNIKPNYYKYSKEDKWIVFPWEERKEN